MDATRTVLPPLGPTGVEPGLDRLGWLAGTLQVWDGGESDRDRGWALVRLLPGPSTLDHRNRHYGTGVRADDWSWAVMWAGLGSAAGTVYAEVRQGHLDRLGPDEGLALAVDLASRGLRPSRVDLAHDCDDSTARTPARLFALRASAWTRTHRGGWELSVRGDGGEKLTVGSRSSERYCRVYLRPGVVRHELELKGATAAATIAALSAGCTIGDAWATEYGRLVRWPSL
jgi:hypothetical protein